MTELLNYRYEIKENLDECFCVYDSQEFFLFNGYDQILKQNVLIKSFKLPKIDVAREIATRFWEREIRLTRKVMSLKKGEIFLPLLDGFVEKQPDSLITVYKSHGKSLMQWVNDVDGLWFLRDTYQKESRKEIWNIILALVNGIESLHQAKIIHRNLTPNSIYYSDVPGEEDVKIGGFTWSLYLNNLNYILDQKKFRSQKYSIFTPIEIYENERTIAEKNNPFLLDIYAIGMNICFLFWDGFPNENPKNIIEWNQIYNDILLNFRQQIDVFLLDEIELITHCIDNNPKNRIKSLSEIRNIIKKILAQLDNESIEIEQKLKVNWSNNPDSRLIRDISNEYSYNINEILQNPDPWLESEFKNAFIFATGLKEHPLVIQNEKGIIFGLKPIYLKKDGYLNEDVAELYMIYPRLRKRVFEQIQTKEPLTKLINGLQFNPKFYERDVFSKWKRLHSKARDELNKIVFEKNDESEFQERLSIMLEAEKRIDSEQILKFIVLSEPKQIQDFDRATIVVRKDFQNELIGREKRNLFDILVDYKTQDGGLIELSESKDSSSPWNHYSQWKIRKINRENLSIEIERERLKKNYILTHEGVLRPFSMNPSLSLYRRKKYIIENILDNKLLLSTILHSQINSFYLGLDLKIENNNILNILNTIPMFLIQGSPGTGKTWVASTVVSELLKQDPYLRILISCKDHEPLDHLVEAVIEKIPEDLTPKPIIIRTITAEREKEYSQADVILEYSKNSQSRKILSRSYSRCSKKSSIPKQIQKEWLNELKSNSENPSLQWEDEIQKIANIIFTTSTSSALEWLGKNSIPYDYVIIEEAAKAYPLELLLPMSLGQRWLLIGDQKQLPPYMFDEMKENILDIIEENKHIDEKDLIELREKIVSEIKFFEKIFNEFKVNPVLYSKNEYFPCSQLNSQWRLPPKISDMISSIFYNAEFEIMKKNPHPGDPFLKPEYIFNNQLIWINCPIWEKNSVFEESRTTEGSTYNNGEIQAINQFLEKIQLNDQISQEKCDMVIITPYSAQRDRIKNNLASYSKKNIDSQKLMHKCYTVDSYQGKQADIVLISLVRNNSASEIRAAFGFLTSSERLNVMFSRVKKRMVIFGCSELIKKFQNHEEGKAINAIYEFITENGIIIPYE